MITEILSSMGALAVIIYFSSLVRVMFYEKEINKLHGELKNKIDVEKKQPVSMTYMNGSIRVLREKYQPEIEELERKRRFILEKLPFIKN